MSCVDYIDDDIEWYMVQVNKIPKLSRESEKELAIEYIETKSPDAKRKLFESKLKFVVWIAKKYAFYGVPVKDLIQEGNIGLMHAIDRYDPHTDITLATYSIRHIRYFIMNYVFKNMYNFKLGTTKLNRKLFYLLRDEYPDEKIKQLAIQHNVSERDVWDQYNAMKNIDIVRDDVEENFSEYDSPINSIPSNSDLIGLMIDEDESAYIDEKLNHAIAKLDTRWKEIIIDRYSDTPSTYAMLGEKYGVSFQRIKQIEDKAIKQLRKELT